MSCVVHETKGFSPLEDKSNNLSNVTTRKSQTLQQLLPSLLCFHDLFYGFGFTCSFNVNMC